MGFKSERRKLAAAILFVFFLFQTISSLNVCAYGREGVAVVYLKQIKPYQSLSDGIVAEIKDKTPVKVFKLDGKADNDEIEQELRVFNPSVVVCIGDRAYEICKGLNFVHFVLAYNTDLLKIADPLCLLKYLKPDSKNVIAMVDENSVNDKRRFLTELALRHGLKLGIKKSGSGSWKELLADNDAAFLDEGVLVIKHNGGRDTFSDGVVVAVGEQNNHIYKQLKQVCLSELQKIDRFIDLGDC